MGGGFAAPPLHKTIGPVSLALLAAHKIGRVPQAEHGVFTTLRERVVNLFDVSPSEIRWEAKRDAELGLFKEWASGKIAAPVDPF